MDIDYKLIKWLLEGDVSIQYQTHRDLLESDSELLANLKPRIATEGWGYEFLIKQKENGHWGQGFYQTKWISSHYTLLDIRNLCTPKTKGISKAINIILKENKSEDGGINPAREIIYSDVCVNGMFLTYACYYEANEDQLKSVIDFIIGQQLKDGGFNCTLNRSGAKHSSMHSTISLLEGIREYINKGYKYRVKELEQIEIDSREFLLKHKLYRSDKSNEIIHKSMTMLSYPSRWKYDILRSLDYFRSAEVSYDSRMEDALNLLISKQKKDGTWPVQAKHQGKVHFDMEKTGNSSRINTLRSLRVLKFYKDYNIGSK